MWLRRADKSFEEVRNTKSTKRKIETTPINVKSELHVARVRLGHDASDFVEFFALEKSGQGGIAVRWSNSHQGRT
jgi:hypothetical protein